MAEVVHITILLHLERPCCANLSSVEHIMYDHGHKTIRDRYGRATGGL